MPPNVVSLEPRATADVPFLLERARKRLGWSQWRAARELGVDPRTWQRWESGDCAAPLARVMRSRELWHAFLLETGDAREAA